MPETELVDAVLGVAAEGTDAMRLSAPRERAAWLREAAGALDGNVAELVAIAIEETHLSEARLRSELLRTTYQLRTFAEVLEEGSFLEAVIDTAWADHPVAPQPDLRRVLEPIGIVLVFAASNFPFAFSVAGGDTASALAAGCPVVVKAHPGHPKLSRRTMGIMTAALAAAGAPDGATALIEGVDEGVQALLDPRLAAAAFTGSVRAGRHLFDLASGRPEPIPFYGELGSLNPVIVTSGALARRGAAVVQEFMNSCTIGAGQFCTKPGLICLPKGHQLDDALAAAAMAVEPAALLNTSIEERLAARLAEMRAVSSLEVLAAAASQSPTGVTPTIFRTDVVTLSKHADVLLEEAFGPVGVVADYANDEDLQALLERLHGSLTATIHAEDDEIASLGSVLEMLRKRAGRVIWNGWPTGVAVAWATHHGGPYPATTSALHTSVGATAIRRFQRPVCYQSVPQALLPAALRDHNALGIPRRVNGKLSSGDVLSDHAR